MFASLIPSRLFFNKLKFQMRQYPFKMQTSITSFFKSKTPVKEKSPEPISVDSDNDSVEEIENKQINKEAPRVARPPKKSPEKSPKKSPSSNSKRPASDSDSDDEVVKMPSNKRRLVLESPDSTPIKAAKVTATEEKSPKSSDEAEQNMAKEDGGETLVVEQTKQAAVGTPAKKVPFPMIAQQSPLMNPDALIKLKISSGAFALHENIGRTWFKALQGEFDKPYFKKLSEFIKTQRQSKTVFPPAEKVFTWTHYHPIRDTRVVIIGQDPYHGPNQAHGLSFSVQKGVAIPKSLQNIYKELQSDVANFKSPGHGELTGWAKQGVLMLNACLTVNRGEANSHSGKGWEQFTDAVISYISKNANHNVVFLLWGRFAQKKSSLIDKRHKIFNAAHPSPFSADNGFFGCKHFSQTNAHLRGQKLSEIDWTAL